MKKLDRYEASRVLGARTLEARKRMSAVFGSIFVWITIRGWTLEHLVKIEISATGIFFILIYIYYALIIIVKSFWVLGLLVHWMF